MKLESIDQKIQSYWDKRSENFSRTRRQELASVNAKMWKNLLSDLLPPPDKGRVLDVGTGAGFFPIILAELGYRVTGIDTSAGMIREARQNLSAYGYAAEFMQMNAQEPDFPDGHFAAVISRNLTWTLPDVMQAYAEWHRVLQLGGVLLNFDSDYGEIKFSGSSDPKHVHNRLNAGLLTECNSIKDELSISARRRPLWDAEFLRRLGMDVTVNENIAPQVHQDTDMEYDNVPLFAIRAVKKLLFMD